MLCRLGIFLSPAASISFSLVADHMATVLVCDKARESMLVSSISEPILAFGAMKQWNERGLCPSLKSIRTALIRGIVNEGTLGEISAMILLLKSMDKLNAGLGWSNVRDFLRNLVKVKQNIEEENINEENFNNKKTSKKNIEESIEKKLDDLIPKESNHFIQWFGKFKHSNLCF
jgi:hypothetical protein